jgi:hypothetical protein
MDLTNLIYLSECAYEQLMSNPNNQCLIVEYNDRAKEVNTAIGWQGLKIIQ